ncbi:hypothetical protein SUGI_0365480 [Cryptomeria japonica]|uniref:heavy metal-associated isoprenylated plant protein 39-like n=1 Tax=Cryptomeria japonica TaxID=3369 RepID=UPI00240899D1|nr:heavy metal-associated isoprenylated plant protein 39-like [Cryptomeria japonica]GLJ20132.1 hypothetical protein SUGI_0365480 [Cryptomeria japonica]
MKKSTVINVDICCCKCKQKVMMTAAKFQGVDSIEADGSKNTLTVVGEVDPVKIINKMRKCKNIEAEIISVGPAIKIKEKKKEDKVEENLPKCCPNCYVWHVYDTEGIDSNPCSIM